MPLLGENLEQSRIDELFAQVGRPSNPKPRSLGPLLELIRDSSSRRMRMPAAASNTRKVGINPLIDGLDADPDSNDKPPQIRNTGLC